MRHHNASAYQTSGIAAGRGDAYLLRMFWNGAAHQKRGSVTPPGGHIIIDIRRRRRASDLWATLRAPLHLSPPAQALRRISVKRINNEGAAMTDGRRAAAAGADVGKRLGDGRVFQHALVLGIV